MIVIGTVPGILRQLQTNMRKKRRKNHMKCNTKQNSPILGHHDPCSSGTTTVNRIIPVQTIMTIETVPVMLRRINTNTSK
jgi:hypothetical protein